jgi:hypothetical protein
MCRVAGEVCDGLHVHPFHSPKYIREVVLPAVQQGLKLGTRHSDSCHSTAERSDARGRPAVDGVQTNDATADTEAPAIGHQPSTIGMDPDFTLAGSCFVIVGDTEAERSRMAEEVRQQISFYASTRTYEPVLAAHGWEALTRELHHKSRQGDWKGMARLVTDEMLDVFATFGTWSGIGRKLRERYAGLLDRISLYSVRGISPADDPRLQQLAREPEFGIRD